MVLEQMRHMQITQDNLVQRLNATEEKLINTTTQLATTMTQLNATQVKLNATATQLDKTRSDLENMKTLRNNSKMAVTVASTSFQGHEYILTRPAVVNVHMMELQCQVLGGYLVEVDDQQEYDVIVKLIKENKITLPGETHPSGGWVLLGATDWDSEGNWTYVHSGKPVTFFSWTPGNPSNSGNSEDCMALHLNDPVYGINDYPCIINTEIDLSVCEIPL